MKAFALPALVLSLLCPAAERRLEAVRATGPIRVDGRLEEADWSRCAPATGFTVSWPTYGKEPALATEVRILYDDKALYVAARMHHPKGAAKVIHRLHRRDQDSSSDWFGVYFDSLRDRRTAFGFLVNAAGVQRDLVYTGDSSSGDSSWDAVWESAVKVDPDGWTAELRIPFSVLRLDEGTGGRAWGVNFSRSDQGPFRETSWWELAPRNVAGFASRFPDLEGIRDVSPSPRREFVPYLSAQRKFETSQAHDDRGWTRRAGLDVHLGLGTASQMDLTLRPDFGQVEVDQAVLNLGTYETFFPEKRPFFLEGMEIFQVPGPSLFYSRRIGRSLSDPDLPDGTTLLDRPAAAEIAGAAKFTAKYAGGLSVGVLGALAETAHGTVRDADGTQRTVEVAPATSYGVVRALQVLDEGGSYVGFFGSQVREAGPLGRQAQVGAVDGVYKTRDRAFLVETTLAHSEDGPKGDLERGYRARWRVQRRWRDGFTAELQGARSSRTFNPNDLGALSRPDERIDYLYLDKIWDRTWTVLRNWEVSGSLSNNRDSFGRPYDRSAYVSARTDFTNFYSIFGGAGLTLNRYDDRELRTFTDPRKKYLRFERTPTANLGFDTPGNRPWYFRLQAWRTWDEGGPSQEWDAYHSLKLTPSLEVQLDTFYGRYEGERRYLETQGDVPVTGLRRMSQLNQTVRVSYGLSPTCTLQVFAQWLLANWAFRDLKAWVDDDTLKPTTTQDATAFSDRVWTVNVIGRWEFRPGSALYLVYVHGAQTDALMDNRATLNLQRDFKPMNHLPSDDALQAKISWLFR